MKHLRWHPTVLFTLISIAALAVLIGCEDEPSGDEASLGSGLFVAVGEQGELVTSPDGTSWTIQNSGTVQDFTGISFGNGLFVAIGSFRLRTSLDGVTWSENMSVVNSDLDDIVYSDGLFTVLGLECGPIIGDSRGLSCHGTMFTSPDGIDWTLRRPGILSGERYNSIIEGPINTIVHGRIAVGNGAFVVIEHDGSTLYQSSDGDTWVETQFADNFRFRDTIFGNNSFVVVGDDGLVLTSPDGLVWTERTIGMMSLQGINYENGIFIATADNGVFFVSSDSMTWEQHDLNMALDFQQVSFGNEMYVGVGGPGGLILTSPDGISWTQINSPTDVLLRDIVFGYRN